MKKNRSLRRISVWIRNGVLFAVTLWLSACGQSSCDPSNPSAQQGCTTQSNLNNNQGGLLGGGGGGGVLGGLLGGGGGGGAMSQFVSACRSDLVQMFIHGMIPSSCGGILQSALSQNQQSINPQCIEQLVGYLVQECQQGQLTQNCGTLISQDLGCGN